MSGPFTRRSRGSVFILVVWSVAFLGALALALAERSAQSIQLAAYRREKVVMRAQTLNSMQKAQAAVAGEKTGPDTLKDDWALAGLVDEERKINVNTASRDVLARLFAAAAGMTLEDARVAASAAVDWRDPDQVALEGGSEDGYYGSREKPFVPRNGPFVFLEELKLLKGIDGAAFLKIRDHATVHGNGKVNINTATRPALYATGFNPQLVEKLDRYRRGPDGISGTLDDAVFDDLTKMIDQMRMSPGLTQEEQGELYGAVSQGRLSVNSAYFSVAVRAASGKRSSSATGVVDRGRQLVGWRE